MCSMTIEGRRVWYSLSSGLINELVFDTRLSSFTLNFSASSTQLVEQIIDYLPSEQNISDTKDDNQVKSYQVYMVGRLVKTWPNKDKP